MTSLSNNDDVRRLLTMQMTMEALEDAYQQLARRDAVCRPRIDIRIPTGEGDRVYQWGTMEGGSSVSGYFAIRMKSDVIYEQEYAGVRTQEKYCSRPGRFCGLVLLTDVRNLRRADHLLGGGQPPGQPVRGRGRKSLRGGEGVGTGPRAANRVAPAGHP